MKRRVLATALLAAVLFLASTTSAPRALASDTTQSVLIGVGVAAGVAIITLVAIFMADREDPDFMLLVEPRPRREPPPGIGYGLACAPRDGALPLACW